ncbi:nuclear transport factor 2 family protein [Geodermatophilus sp. SYSU D00815]
MDEAGVRATLQHYIDCSADGDEERAHEIYVADAVLEFPQSGERFEGVPNFLEWRRAYPAESVDIVPRRVRGRDDVWAAELGVRYDDGPWDFGVDILEFTGGKVSRESIYWAQAWEPPAWRAPWRATDSTAVPTTPPAGDLDADTVRATMRRYFDAADPDTAHEIYAPDAVLEFPQSGERFVGVENFRAWRRQYPARVDFTIDRVRGGGATWFVELQLRYDEGPWLFGVDLAEFRDGLVSRETAYSMDPWDAPDWRARWRADAGPQAVTPPRSRPAG